MFYLYSVFNTAQNRSPNTGAFLTSSHICWNTHLHTHAHEHKEEHWWFKLTSLKGSTQQAGRKTGDGHKYSSVVEWERAVSAVLWKRKTYRYAHPIIERSVPGQWGRRCVEGHALLWGGMHDQQCSVWVTEMEECRVCIFMASWWERRQWEDVEHFVVYQAYTRNSWIISGMWQFKIRSGLFLYYRFITILWVEI